MHLAYGIYNLTLGLELWMVEFDTIAISIVPMSFHIMTIIGSFIGAFMYDKIHISRIHVSDFKKLVLTHFVTVHCFNILCNNDLILNFFVSFDKSNFLFSFF